MAKYKSIHTGQEIDDAVGKVKDGEVLTKENADGRYLKLQGGGTLKYGDPSAPASEYSEMDISPRHIWVLDKSKSRYTFVFSCDTNMEFAALENALSLSGEIINIRPASTFNVHGNIHLVETGSGQKRHIYGLGTPESDNEAVNKGYVDDLIGDINAVLDQINGEVV